MNEIISNSYSYDHKAIDIVSGNNTSDIIALDNGIVQTVVTNYQGPDHQSTGLATYGNYIEIKQDNGKTVLYAHLQYGSITVKKGDYVTKGTIIGTMGETGNAYGKHLHLEIKDQNNDHENPLIYLNQTPLNTKKNENSTKSSEKINTPKTITQNTNAKTKYLSNKKYKYNSIVDALKMINVDSSYQNRKNLAQKNGISNYTGTANQNIKMLQMLKEGILKY